MKSLRAYSLLALVIAATAAAHADTVTNLTVPYNTNGLWPNWASSSFNGSQIAAAPTNGNTGTGITFANWSGQFYQTNPGSTELVNGLSVALTSDSSVNTLMNLFYGSPNTVAVVTFTNSDNQTATYSLVGDQTVRDFNESSYANDLQGYNTDPTLGDVTTQNWWNNYGSGGSQRLDVQTFVLPTAWAGTDLTSISIFDPANSGSDDILSAAQVVTAAGSATPEPSSLALLGTGVLGLAGMVRRRMAR